MKHLYELLKNTPLKELSNIDNNDDYYLYVKKILIQMSNTNEDALNNIFYKLSKDGLKCLSKDELIILIELYLGKLLTKVNDDIGKTFLETVGINTKSTLYTTDDINYLRSGVKYIIHYYKIYF